jgi:inhibitor of cysteine peptidase
MKRLLFILILGMVLSVACAPLASAPVDNERNVDLTIEANEPVTLDDMPVPTGEPIPQSNELLSGKAIVDRLDVQILESFPLQIHAMVTGTTGDGCTELDEITTTRDENTFYIDITTLRPAAAICDSIAVPFEEIVSLNVYGLPAGDYIVDANGQTALFTLQTDNILPEPSETLQPDPGGGLPGDGYLYGLAHVTSIEVFPQAQPPGAAVLISGWLSTPCVEIYNYREELFGSTIHLTVETREPVGAACIQVIQDFTEQYTLQQLPSSGTYTLVVNDVATQFTIP